MIRLSCRFLLVLLGGLAFAVAASADSVSVTMSCFTGFPGYSGFASDCLPSFSEVPPQIQGYPQIANEFSPTTGFILVVDPGGFGLSSNDGKLFISGRTTSLDFTKLVFSRAVTFTTATDSLVWTDFSTGERLDLPQAGATGGGHIQFLDIYGGAAQGSFQVGFDVPSTPVPEPESLTLLSLGLLLGVVPRLLRRA